MEGLGFLGLVSVMGYFAMRMVMDKQNATAQDHASSGSVVVPEAGASIGRVTTPEPVISTPEPVISTP
ncbi:MAG: hypothetical protein HQM00_07850, partial [Magnetococcales bacterium]|nr:hypothetical protein [Magnetococcales bacterium]